MKIRFTKMHGQGNDFVVLDGVRQAIDLSPAQARALADRHFGVGCDQVLVVEKARETDNDFRYRIFNADGGEVEQCGNGARCFARFVLDEGLTTKREIRVETASGVIRPKVEASGQVTVDMGAPRLAPREVPFLAEEARLVYPLVVAGGATCNRFRAATSGCACGSAARARRSPAARALAPRWSPEFAAGSSTKPCASRRAAATS